MIHNRLNRFINNENRTDYRYYSLNHITVLLNYFDNPHLKINTIHIAGTNGKGSVAHMLNIIFIKSGYKTGLYTSPHLLKINERIRIDNQDISDELFNRYIDDILKFTEADSSITPTFFDVVTVIAFRYFHDSQVEIAIIECGLGGRLDSTNVLNPVCSIITDISADHTSILGSSIEKIAEEKSGIIKKNIPIITSNTNSNIINIFKKKSETNSADLFIYNRDFKIENIREDDNGFRFDYQISKKFNVRIKNINLGNPVEIQIKNSSLAITSSIIARKNFPNLSDKNIKNGLNELCIPGRFQILSQNPLIIFDPAHNESAISEIIKLLAGRYGNYKITLILSLMMDKNLENILSIIEDLKTPVIYYILNDIRCYRPSRDTKSMIFNDIIDDEATLFMRLNRITSSNSLFFFSGTFRLYRVALDYAEKIRLLEIS